MKKQRVNPRNQPATEADVRRARKQGQQEALRLAWLLFFTALRDKFGWGHIRLERLWHKIEDTSERITKGYVTFDDLEEELNKAGFILEDSTKEGKNQP